MVVKEFFLTPGAAHGRPGGKITPEGAVVHYVANPGSTPEANRKYFNDTGKASCHYIIGVDGAILHIMPDDEPAWHAGKAYGAQWDAMAKTNNSRFLGIECCHPTKEGKFSHATRASLIELCADLCARHGWNPIKDIYRHYDVCGKFCPLWYVNLPAEWDALKKDIEAAWRGAAAGLYGAASDWAKTAWDWAKAEGLNDGTRPRDASTREEVAAILYRYDRKGHGT
jgi:N-acetylmuramoyl-L-alanine amidase CwlA